MQKQARFLHTTNMADNLSAVSDPFIVKIDFTGSTIALLNEDTSDSTSGLYIM